MSPSREALELLQERRRMVRDKPIFTERRRALRFWRRWQGALIVALVFAWYELHRLFG